MLRNILRKPDTWLGLVALVAGIALALTAAEYRLRASHFPFWLSVIMALSGLGILVQSVVSNVAEHRGSDPSAIVLGALPFAGVVFLWVLAITYGLGYVIPGFFAAMALLFITGERRPMQIALRAALLVIVCFLFFSVVFNVRLPEIQLITDLVRPIRRFIH